MTIEFNRPFSPAEMEAMRRAASEEGRAQPEARILSQTIALLRRIARKIPFAEDVLALYHCARDPMTETRVKVIVVAALAYFVMPVDLVPDWIPLLGFGDDAAVIAAAIATVKGAVTDLHRKKAREQLQEM